jgi:hypothetical protein
MKLESTLCACLLVCVTACGHSIVAPRATSENVIGTWGEDPRATSVPGYVFVMTLSDAADVITGNGSYSSSGGPFGSLAVSGTAHADSVHLQVVYRPADLLLLPPDTARVDGAFATRDRIAAVRVRGGAAQAITLIQLQVVAPVP